MMDLQSILSSRGDSATVSETPATTTEPAALAAATESKSTDVKTAAPAKVDAPAAASSAVKADEKSATEKPAEGVKLAEETQAQKDERARNEKGQFTKVEEQIAGLQRSAAEDRRKRQEETARREAAEEKLRKLEAAKNPTEETQPTDFWADPEAAFKERMTPELQKIQQKHEEEVFAVYEEFEKSRHANYDEVVDALITEAKDDPRLSQQLNAQLGSTRNKPAALYNFALNHREMKETGGDFVKYKAKVTAEVRAELDAAKVSEKAKDAEIERLKAQLDNVAKVPESLIDTASASRGTTPTKALERTPLNSILEQRQKRSNKRR